MSCDDGLPGLIWTVQPITKAGCSCGWSCDRHVMADDARLCMQAHLVSHHRVDFDHEGAMNALRLMAPSRADNKYSVKLEGD